MNILRKMNELSSMEKRIRFICEGETVNDAACKNLQESWQHIHLALKEYDQELQRRKERDDEAAADPFDPASKLPGPETS